VFKAMEYVLTINLSIGDSLLFCSQDQIIVVKIMNMKYLIVVFIITGNVLALGEEADFEAQIFLPELNLIRSTKLHLSTEPAFLPNAC